MRAERLRIAERGRGREMILERDFSLHVSSRRYNAARNRLCADLAALANTCRSTHLPIARLPARGRGE
jgi:hypothetical protein